MKTLGHQFGCSATLVCTSNANLQGLAFNVLYKLPFHNPNYELQPHGYTWFPQHLQRFPLFGLGHSYLSLFLFKIVLFVFICLFICFLGGRIQLNLSMKVSINEAPLKSRIISPFSWLCPQSTYTHVIV